MRATLKQTMLATLEGDRVTSVFEVISGGQTIGVININANRYTARLNVECRILGRTFLLNDDERYSPIIDKQRLRPVCIFENGQKAGEAVLEAWGFKWVDRMIGIKPGLGLGNRTRHCYETCLIGVKGNMPVDFHGQPDWMFFPRQDHSHKPEEMYAIIERMHQDRDYLELFARNRPSNPNWYIWGDEAEGGSDIYIPGYPVPKYSDRVQFIPPEHKPQHLKKEEA